MYSSYYFTALIYNSFSNPPQPNPVHSLCTRVKLEMHLNCALAIASSYVELCMQCKISGSKMMNVTKTDSFANYMLEE